MKQRKPEKHFESNLFSANNGVYDYSAVVTDIKDRKLQDLLLFLSGRGAWGNSIGKIKTNFALDLMQKAGMKS
jgi:hypothetical protein